MKTVETMAGRKYRRVTLGVLVFLAGYTALVCVGGQISLAWAGESLKLQPATVDEVYISMIAHGVIAMLCSLWALHIRRKQVVGPLAPKIALLLSLLLLIVSCDRIVCVLFPPPDDSEYISMPHSERGWFHWPNMVGSGGGRTVKTNSLGFRSPELPDGKMPGECRVLCLGDSITFGFCLDSEECYVMQTEHLLREACPGRTVHAINAGVCGYQTSQECHLLQNEGVRVRPDIVILTYCLNDMTDLIGIEPGSMTYPEVLFSIPNDSHWSGIVRAIRSVYFRRRAIQVSNEHQWGRTDLLVNMDSVVKTQADVYREPLVPAVAEAWRRSLEELGKMDAFCQLKQLPWVLVYCPIEDQLGPDAILDQPERRLLDWAKEQDIPYVDMGAVFEKDMATTGNPLSYYMMDCVHPSAEGSRLMAEAVVRFLEEHHLPPFDKPGEP